MASMLETWQVKHEEGDSVTLPFVGEEQSKALRLCRRPLCRL